MALVQYLTPMISQLDPPQRPHLKSATPKTAISRSDLKMAGHVKKYQAAGSHHTSVFRRALANQASFQPQAGLDRENMTEQGAPISRPRYNVTVTGEHF